MSRRTGHLRTQRGFALVGAIFILVVLSALGAFMLTMTGIQSGTALFSVQGARAYQAARSGIEWGIYQVVNTGCSNGSFTVEGFAVNLTCVDINTYTEGSDTYHVYKLTSKAELGSYGSAGYVSRTLTAQVGGP